MPITDLKFEEIDFVGEDISSLPDQVVGQASFIKARFDNVAKVMVALGNYNDLIDALGDATNGDSGADNIGATAVGTGTAETVQGVLEELDTKIDSIPNSATISPPAEDKTIDGTTATLTAAATVAFGDACYTNGSSKLALAKADAIATSYVTAMCAEYDGIAQDATGDFAMPGSFIRNNAWNWTVGAPIYLTITGTTGNTLSQTPPNTTDAVVHYLGHAHSADVMYFAPDHNLIELV